MSLARHFVEAHGGRIDVESTLDEGSTFTVTLPRLLRAVGRDGKTPAESLAGR